MSHLLNAKVKLLRAVMSLDPLCSRKAAAKSSVAHQDPFI